MAVVVMLCSCGLLLPASGIARISKWMAAGVAGVMVVQIYIGYMQLHASRVQQIPAMEALQGTVRNSGIFNCLMVTMMPFTFLGLKGGETWPAWVRKAGFVLFLAISAAVIFGVIVSGSRTALIAAGALLAAAVFLVWKRKLANSWKRIPVPGKLAVVVMGIVLSAAVGYFLFGMKKASAIGRVMKTEVAWGHVSDHFWTGTGLGRFSWYYPQWQSDFFRERPDAPEAYRQSAGESFLLFNEWLQWWLETGALGGACLVIIMILVFRARSLQYPHLMTAIKLTVFVILSCGFTTYVLHVNAILLLLVFCCIVAFRLDERPWPAFLERVFVAGKKASGGWLTAVGALVVCVMMVRWWPAYRAAAQWRMLQVSGKAPAQSEYAQWYPVLKHNGKFLAAYAIQLAADDRHGDALPLLNEARKTFISRNVVEAMANACEETGDYACAEKNWRWLGYYLPGRLSPKGELMRLYLQTGDTAAAQRIAGEILQTPVKIPSAAALRIRRAARDLVHEKFNN
ncbi:O-antigen ligase family protein [Chitinophaga caseinilytica]|uniref:O-antigen ligase family protein n=1 Tax=Chitinophaga caseinilytica TaxID=2267521 RepID=A0ABZ2Z5R4_9BACT